MSRPEDTNSGCCPLHSLQVKTSVNKSRYVGSLVNQSRIRVSNRVPLSRSVPEETCMRLLSKLSNERKLLYPPRLWLNWFLSLWEFVYKIADALTSSDVIRFCWKYSKGRVKQQSTRCEYFEEISTPGYKSTPLILIS